MDKIDFERLRSDLIDYYGTAIASGFKVAIIDISNIEMPFIIDIIFLFFLSSFIERYSG